MKKLRGNQRVKSFFNVAAQRKKGGDESKNKTCDIFKALGAVFN